MGNKLFWGLNVRGNTFIEVIISLFIISVGLLAFSRISLGIIKSNSQNSRVTTAIYITQDKLETLKQKGYARLKEGTFFEYGIQKGVTRKWLVKKDSIIPNTAEVTVTTSWNIGNKEKTIALSTIIGK